jgi:hypothetical protein
MANGERPMAFYKQEQRHSRFLTAEGLPADGKARLDSH